MFFAPFWNKQYNFFWNDWIIFQKKVVMSSVLQTTIKSFLGRHRKRAALACLPLDYS
jgi:hypothetical protein